jgi:DNA-directed RNA polymerase subunit RPC12/RpoP
MHYNLLSGVDTSTTTARCDGCGKRFLSKERKPRTTTHDWLCTPCSLRCRKRADRLYTERFLGSRDNELIKSIFTLSGGDTTYYEERYAYLSQRKRDGYLGRDH